MPSVSTLTPKTLLAHEPFVKAVVRGLLVDDGQVQDVVQETWIAALRRPPRSVASLRSWLSSVARSKAMSLRRSSQRRAARERACARPEAVESAAESHARLEAHRAVVDAVLALRAPYREVVLLRYYQELSPAEIARRTQLSSATVRSQLHRAHALLRERLDEREGRAAWAVLVAPGLRLGAPAGWAAVGGVVAVVGLSVLLYQSVAPATTSPASIRPGVVGHQARPFEAPAAIDVGAGSARRPGVVAVGQQTALGDLIDELKADSVPELLEVAVWTQRELQKRLLTPSPKLVASQASLLALPGTGVARLLRGNGAESDWAHAILKRGGGSYYSFATRDHSYDREPDISFHRGMFDTDFIGGQIGLLMWIGERSLMDLPNHPGAPPAWLPKGRHADWGHLWSVITLENKARLHDETRHMRRSLAPSGVGDAFLVRLHSPSEHDHLVALRVLDLDERGCTIAWRILNRWPLERRSEQQSKDRHREVREAPEAVAEALEGASERGLFALLEEVRRRAHPLLFEIPESLREEYSAALGGRTSFAQRSGFGRILRRGTCDALVKLHRGGSYYSFAKNSNEYGGHSDLALRMGEFVSGFAGGDDGWLLDLGGLDFENLRVAVSGRCPAVDDHVRAVWEFMWSVRPVVENRRRQLSEEDDARRQELGLTCFTPAQIGHTYLLRTALYDDRDQLIVFTVLDGDDYGLTLAWRLLKSSPVRAGR